MLAKQPSMFRRRLCSKLGPRACRRLSHIHKTQTNGPETSIFPPVSRSQTTSVLETSQLDVITDLRAEHKTAQANKLEVRIRLSHFLQAVFLGDYTGALEALAKMRYACVRTSMSEKNAMIYATSFVTLLTQACLSNKKPLSVTHLTDLVNAAHTLPKSVVLVLEGRYIGQIHQLLLAVFLRALAVTPSQNRVTCVNLVAYIRELQSSLDVSLDVFLQLVKTQYQYLLPQYNRVFMQNEVLPDTKEEDYVTLENKLEQVKQGKPSLSYAALCQFIESACFDASQYGQTQDTKYYEIADSLSERERAKFMEEYLRFNYKKQLLVEDASQAVYKSVSSAGAMMGFTSLHRKWVRGWLTAATERVNAILKIQGELEKFTHIFAYLPPNHIVAMCLTHLLAATVPNTDAKVLSLATRLSHTLRKELRQANPQAFSGENSSMILSSDHSIEFVCTIINIILETCKIPEGIQMRQLSHEDENTDGKNWDGKVFQFLHIKDAESTSKFTRYGAIKAHPVVASQFRVYRELFHTGSYRLPMLHPPKPWTSPRDGGFFSIPLPLVKSPEPKTSDIYLEKAHKTGQLTSVYQSVNALGACAWTINPFTLDVFNKLLTTPHLPGLPTSLNAPIAEKMPKPEKKTYVSEEKYHSAFSRWKYAEAERAKKHQEVANLRIYYDMVSRLASSFAKRGEVLYLPHNMDFRGRVYPSVSFLSHQSEDLIRSLLMFWDAKPLGQDGYNWLSYHFANLFHKTKMTMDQSLQFVESAKARIMESANDPHCPDSFWLKAENPWQVLALCKEFDKIWNFKGDLSTYRTRLAVHQDGSCNGLQHYSALGADTEAARAVNVLPDANIQDVYTTVLGLVTERIENDKNSGKNSGLANEALNLLSRKLIKQTVMTTVYGVTSFGAMHQVKRRIDELSVDKSDTEISESEKLKLASYISQNVLGSIADLFSGAQIIQNWLVDNCTRCIQAYDWRDFPENTDIDFFSGKHYRPMMWTSLSGFPVIQMYRKRLTREIQTPLQKLILNDDTRLAPIDELKSKNGIAPNFIHSIDAIHLLMTCLSAKVENITFASVHDSFWTHPSEVNTLSRIIREEFARLHSSDIIENLRHDLQHVNKNSFQLVWVDIVANPQFVEQLRKLRANYPSAKKRMPSEMLMSASLQTELYHNQEVDLLVKEFKPVLLWKSSGSGTPVIYNADMVPTSIDTKISTKTHVPLLVPVQILDAPEVGTLDIQQVIHSKYFFS